jgi:hypothetical protein
MVRVTIRGKLVAAIVLTVIGSASRWLPSGRWASAPTTSSAPGRPGARARAEVRRDGHERLADRVGL